MMVRTAVKSNDDAESKERMTTAAAEPTEAEIERLLDRANLPEEVDGEDGAAYLGNIGNATIAIGDGDNGGGGVFAVPVHTCTATVERLLRRAIEPMNE